MKKYPRTWHHPLSMSLGSDDKRHKTDSIHHGKIVAVSKKMDGECTTMTTKNCYARSLDTVSHVSRNWVRTLHGSNIGYTIPEGMRVCGENLFARHSIAYDNLQSYFQVFNIWDGDVCLSFEDEIEWCELLGLTHVPVLYVGEYNVKLIEDLIATLDTDKDEGLVIRNVDAFSYTEFKSNVSKIVRKNHVQTDEHWMSKQVIPNRLENGNGNG